MKSGKNNVNCVRTDAKSTGEGGRQFNSLSVGWDMIETFYGVRMELNFFYGVGTKSIPDFFTCYYLVSKI